MAVKVMDSRADIAENNTLRCAIDMIDEMARWADKRVLQRTDAPMSCDPQRFSHFSQIVTRIAADDAGLDWRPDVVHANDWHTGLVPLWLIIPWGPVRRGFGGAQAAFASLRIL